MPTTATTNPNVVSIHDIGELHDPKTMFFRVAVGNAKSSAGEGYEFTVNAGDYAPIIRSNQTGKWFTLSWEDIVSLAIAKGIDNK